MDFLIEGLLQIVVQIVGELVIEGAFQGVAAVLRRKVGRWITGSLLGLGFGVVWGRHLSGAAHYPRLLWVSLALGVVALVLALGRQSSEASNPTDNRSPLDLTWLVAPPWRWGSERLWAFALINSGIAMGVLAAFRPSLR